MAAKVVCLLGPEFEDSELRVPYDRLRKAGIDVEIVGQTAGESIEGKLGRETVRAERGIDDAEVEAYDALFIPGGHAPDHLRADARFVDFVRRFDERGKPIAAVCHGPQLFLSAGIVRGRRLTAWRTVQGDLRQAGADVVDQPVVEDRNWITSRQPSDLDAFSEAFVGRLTGGAETEAQRLMREAAAEEHQRLAAERSPHRGSL